VGRTFVAANRYLARLFHVSIVSERALQGVHRIVSDHVETAMIASEPTVYASDGRDM
jgi:hypothetical protein